MTRQIGMPDGSGGSRVPTLPDATASRLLALSPGGRWAWRVLIGIAIIVGLFLRVYQLRTQMLIDDEWHAVRMLLRTDLHGIATHFGLADYCIPLTLYYRWLFQRGALSEWSMHLPLLLAGVALLLAAPWLLRATVSRPTRALWVGLLAVSPSLIYFSRTARPYALIALFGFIAIVAFRNWHDRRGDRRVWAAVYVAAAFVAGWAHLLSLVFTLWPFAYYGAGALRDAARAPSRAQSLRALGALFALGFATALPLALALGPPLLNDWGALAGKAGADSVTATSLYRTLLMQFGIAQAWLCALMLALLAFGAYRLWRRDRDLVALSLSATLVGMAVIALARPAWIQHAPVLVRYAAPILPFLLLYVAEGCVGVLERVRWPVAAVALAALAVGGLVASGPLPSWYYTPNQFMEHALFQFDYDPHENPYSTELQLGPVSPFYRELARKPPASVTLIETPARAHSNYMPDPWLQKIHRQNVKFALASPVCGVGDWDEYPYTADVHFRRIVPLADLLDGAHFGGSYLVLRLHPWTLPPGKDFPWPVPWPDMPACVAKVAARLGEPVYRDDQIAVFALSAASISSTNR